MTSLTGTNVRMALQSLRTTKMRSALTMLGIIIGVTAVIMAVSLGEGVRRDVSVTLTTDKDNVVSIRPGKLVDRNRDGSIKGVDYLGGLGANPLTDQDVQTIAKLPETGRTVPLAIISGRPVSLDGTVYNEGTIIGTTPELPNVIKSKISYGSFFGEKNTNANVAVIGKDVAEQLFKENVPVGRTMTIRGQDFIVDGVFDNIDSNILTTVHDLNKAVFIPYNVAKELSNDNIGIYQILAAPKSTSDVMALGQAIAPKLTANHGGDDDFTILRPDETITVANSALTIATSFVAGIAAISLVVGGIGIMNIMFVSVTERTREIGVRKSIGATNRQIYMQFLIEATILSLLGGVIGVGLGLGGNFIISVLTGLHPAATWQIVLMAVGASTATGIVFGTAPAVKAARKDPIESLRYQ